MKIRLSCSSLFRLSLYFNVALPHGKQLYHKFNEAYEKATSSFWQSAKVELSTEEVKRIKQILFARLKDASTFSYRDKVAEVLEELEERLAKAH